MSFNYQHYMHWPGILGEEMPLKEAYVQWTCMAYPTFLCTSPPTNHS